MCHVATAENLNTFKIPPRCILEWLKYTGEPKLLPRPTLTKFWIPGTDSSDSTLKCVPKKEEKKTKEKKTERLHHYSTTLFWNRRLRREAVGTGRVLSSPVLLKLELSPRDVHCQATLHDFQVEAEPLLPSLSLQVHACKHYSPQKIKLSLLQEPTFSPSVGGWNGGWGADERETEIPLLGIPVFLFQCSC